MRVRIILNKKTELIVVSFGGVGTTFLIEFLANYFKLNHPNDHDGLKHTHLPPISINKALKVLYIYGDPREAIISLFRRGYHSMHSKKMMRFIPNTKAIPEDWSLSDYLNSGKDRFGFENHFNNWYHKYQVYNTAYIKYDYLWEQSNLKRLFDFLGLPYSQISRFPKRLPRKSKFDNLNTEEDRKINMMYGEFAKKLSIMPQIEIKKANNDLYRKYVSKMFFWGVNHEFLRFGRRSLNNVFEIGKTSNDSGK